MPRFPFFRPKLQDEISSELSFHLEMLVRRLESLGYTPAEARAEAARRMGDMNRVRRDCTRAGEERQRNWNRTALMTGLKQDLHYALRSFRRAPLFTLSVVLTLALGIGATTSVFSLINGVLLTSLPYRSPGRLLQVNEVVPDGARWELSYPAFRDLLERSRSFSHLGGYFGGRTPVNVGGQTLELGTFYLTPDLLPALGVSPELGRGFSEEQAGAGDDNAALIGHGLWVRQFGADPEVVGRQIHLGGTAVTIVGVMPDRFYFPDQSAEVWLPFGPPQPFMENRTVHIMRVVGRLKDGVDAERAREDVSRVFLELQRDFPGADPGHTGTTETLADVMLGGVRLPLLTLFAGVFLVLLITCANVGGLILARAGARGEEMAVRTALGAGRFRLLRQLAAESLLLSAAGGAAGALLAMFAVRWVVPRLPGSVPQVAAIGVDARVLAFTAAVALLAGLGFALIPALGLDGRGPAEALRGGGRRVQGGHAGRGALVMAEVALSIVLVVAAGLLIRSFLRVQSVDPGFTSRNLLLVTTSLPPDRYDPSGAVEFYRALPERLEAIPGVVEASAVSNLPIS
ncbi:MAG: ABC transporter permease, partial [Gemmatimonadales bacterium]